LTEVRARAGALARDFYRRPSLEVAPELLNKLLAVGDGDGDGDRDGDRRRVGRIVEVEAYCGADDPASHAFRGRTARNATMFGPPGHLYVYFTYGMHFCANVVCGEEGEASAVLLRGLTPVAGIDEMWAVRPACHRERDLCAGPARLCLALGLDRSFDGADLVTGDRGVVVTDDGTPPPAVVGVGERVGIRVATDRPWRYYVAGAAGLSRPG
jgi:DNA-3-methyladenine glycosylase